MEHAAEQPTTRIYVYTDEGHGPARVEPPHALVPRGQAVVWENLTPDPIWLLFPRPEVFQDPPVGPVLLDPGSQSDPRPLRKDAKKGGYPYSALRQRPGRPADLAIGGSHPVMIVI